MWVYILMWPQEPESSPMVRNWDHQLQDIHLSVLHQHICTFRTDSLHLCSQLLGRVRREKGFKCSRARLQPLKKRDSSSLRASGGGWEGATELCYVIGLPASSSGTERLEMEWIQRWVPLFKHRSPYLQANSPGNDPESRLLRLCDFPTSIM